MSEAKNNLRKLLEDWEDQDTSAYYLACCLGLLDYDTSFENFRESKGLFWTGNLVSDFLYNTLEKMSGIGVLEFSDDDKYRWNKEFKHLYVPLREKI
jgi:hypothetical protein